MKAIISYIAVLCSAVGYMILFDRNAGGIMSVFLVVVPLVSVFLTLFSRKRVHINVETSDDLLRKNKPCKVTVHASKSTFLPLPVISFSFRATEHFRKPDYDIFRFSMSENRDVSFDIDVLPEVCGNASLTVRKMYITDYLGIFRFKMNVPEVVKNVVIVPEIHEMSDCTEVLRSISDTLPDNDDDETESAAVYGKAAFPGYGYRNYVPGDSLKKVNWKLSSKKGELFVRMDESSGMTLPNIILDLNTPGIDFEIRTGIYYLGLIIECSLSLLDMCVRNGIECRYVYPKSGEMAAEDVLSSEDVERISCEMMRTLTPASVRTDLVSDPDSKSSAVNIICTLGVYEELAETAEASVLNGDYVKVVIPDSLRRDDAAPVPELWLLNENWSVTRAL